MSAPALFDITVPAAGFPGDDDICPVCDMRPCGCPTFHHPSTRARGRQPELAVIVRTLRGGRVVAICDADQPDQAPLAWAASDGAGWTVSAAGRMYAGQLTRRRALALAERVGRTIAAATTTVSALTGDIR